MDKDDLLVEIAKENTAEIDPSTLFDVLSNDFNDPNKIDERFEEIKRKKIWSTGLNLKGLSIAINARQLLHLIDRLAENNIKELRLNGINVNMCYSENDVDCERCYQGWAIKKIVVKSCIIGKLFIEHIFNPNSIFVDVNTSYKYVGNNLIEEIHIIDCDITNDIDRRDFITIKELIVNHQVVDVLRSNYRIRVIKGYDSVYDEPIIDGVQFKRLPSSRDYEFDQLINPILNRNNKGHQLCLKAIYTVLLIKKYRNSVFDYLGRDIIKVICQLLLDTKGTKVWCLY